MSVWSYFRFEWLILFRARVVFSITRNSKEKDGNTQITNIYVVSFWKTFILPFNCWNKYFVLQLLRKTLYDPSEIEIDEIEVVVWWLHKMIMITMLMLVIVMYGCSIAFPPILESNEMDLCPLFFSKCNSKRLIWIPRPRQISWSNSSISPNFN